MIFNDIVYVCPVSPKLLCAFQSVYYIIRSQDIISESSNQRRHFLRANQLRHYQLQQIQLDKRQYNSVSA